MSLQNKQNILVFPCGSEIGLELHRALSTSTYVTLFGASSVSDHGQFVYERYTEGLPFVDDQGFIDAINRVVDNNGIDYLYPAHDSVVLKLAESVDRLHCGLLGSPLDTCRICRSKRVTYATFSTLLRVPFVYNQPDLIDRWPVFIKPDVGQGSKGTLLARDRGELEFYISRDSSLLCTEYLPGAEYTIDCFTDRHGELRFSEARERTRIQNGISVRTHPVQFPDLKEMAQTINMTLKLRGAWFFQAKVTSTGEFALLEIAPRIAGAMALYRNGGVNFALLTLFDALGFDIEILFNGTYLEMDSALGSRFKDAMDYRHIYMDLDDCLIIDDKVHVPAVALLYQAFGMGVKLHLLTRHAGGLIETLNRFRLNGIFDEIIHLKNGENKSEYIKHLDAIFIDDSFAERRSVSKKLAIPVFDLDSLESLLVCKS